ncbi:MAG: winged helix-turn-helix domain-containing protein [Solirubrobacterales bacterium]|nr:winged helix-turn-helix domain-containing protein [Solirubrobacterales bacterium]
METVHGAVDRAWLSQRPGKLLRYLVSQHGRFVPADEIIEALWPGSSFDSENNVRYLVHLLRKRLEPTRPARGRSFTIECLAGAYALGPAVWVDVGTFEQLVDDALSGTEHEIALAQIDQALELYGGDFLSDEPYADWALIERERIRGLAEDALRAAIRIYEERHDFGGALQYARWLTELEPYDSDAQFGVISLCLRCGRRSEAARRYGAFRSRLTRDFNEEPEFTLSTAAASTSRFVPASSSRFAPAR